MIILLSYDPSYIKNNAAELADRMGRSPDQQVGLEHHARTYRIHLIHLIPIRQPVVHFSCFLDHNNKLNGHYNARFKQHLAELSHGRSCRTPLPCKTLRNTLFILIIRKRIDNETRQRVSVSVDTILAPLQGQREKKKVINVKLFLCEELIEFLLLTFISWFL